MHAELELEEEQVAGVCFEAQGCDDEWKEERWVLDKGAQTQEKGYTGLKGRKKPCSIFFFFFFLVPKGV